MDCQLKRAFTCLVITMLLLDFAIIIIIIAYGQV